MENKNWDLTPVPQASTVEIGTECPRRCKGCAFETTRLEAMTPEEMKYTISTLSDYWDHIGQDPEHQLIGARIVEFIGGAGIMNRLSREDLKGLVETARAHGLSYLSFLCDAQLDERAIKDFFEVAAELDRENPSDMKVIIALSMDAMPTKDAKATHRERKTNAAYKMLGRRDDYIVDPEKQNFRFFSTISKRNLSQVPDIERQVLQSGSLLFVAPLTIHSEEVLAETGVTGRLLMGTDTELLVTEEDRPEMERVVAELRELKEEYPDTFLNNDGHFQNMLACCKPIEAHFQANCRDQCRFTTKDGDDLVATPNIRVMRRPGNDELTLGVCTCMVGPVDGEDNYANTKLADLLDIVEGKISTVDVYRKLTADLVDIQCPGCNTRTSIDIKRGHDLK